MKSHMKPESLLAIPIENLQLEQKTINKLRNAKIFTVGEIIKIESSKGLLKVRNVGRTSYEAIKMAVNEIGLYLDGTTITSERYEGSGQCKTDTITPQKTEQSSLPSVQLVSKSQPAIVLKNPEKEQIVLKAITAVEPQVLTRKSPIGKNLLKTAVFVDFEHWFISLWKIHHRRPNLQVWFDDLSKRGQLLEVTFFGDFSERGGMSDEVNYIRRFTNRIIDTKNPSEFSKKSFTDFIILDNIYQKVIVSPEIEQVVIFTGDGDFSSVASYLRIFCGKVVGIYAVDGAFSNQLEGISDWCERLPFSNEPYKECRNAILKNLKYAESHSKSPTFKMTVQMVSDYYQLPDDAVEAELRLLIKEGIIYTVAERSRRDYKVLLNILHVHWDKIDEINSACT